MKLNGYKKIIWQVILVAITVLTLDYLFCFFYEHNLNNKAEQISKIKIDADVLALGSSNVQYLIDPEQITSFKVFNLATNHASFGENLSLLQLWQKNQKLPKAILLGFNPADISLAGTKFHSYNFIAHASDAIVDSLIQNDDKNYYKWMKVPLIRFTYYNSFTLPLIFQGAVKWLTGRGPASKNGFHQSPAGGTGFNNLLELKKKYTQFYVQPDTKALHELENLVRFCDKEKIRVYYFQTPTIRLAKAFFTKKESAWKTYSAIVNKYNACEIDIEEIALKDSDFVSVFHVKREAAKQFSMKLSAVLQKQVQSKVN